MFVPCIVVVLLMRKRELVAVLCLPGCYVALPHGALGSVWSEVCDCGIS